MEIDLNEKLASACLEGDRNSVLLLIEQGADNWNEGLSNTCLGGHEEIVELMIRKGATSWNVGLVNACSGGHIKIAELMISKGATHWTRGLKAALANDHKELVLLMIEKGAILYEYYLESLTDIHIEYLIKKGYSVRQVELINKIKTVRTSLTSLIGNDLAMVCDIY